MDAPRPVPVTPAAAVSNASRTQGTGAEAGSDLRRLPRAAETPDRALFAEPSAFPSRPPRHPSRARLCAAVAPAAAPELKAQERRPAPELSQPAAAPVDPRRPAPEQVAVRRCPGPPAEDSLLNQADRLFTDKKYEEAGRIYAPRPPRTSCPPSAQVWAYCRWVAVVARINARPRTDKEWDEIEHEISSVQRLTPGNWYGEYLQNRVAEARRGGAHPPVPAGWWFGVRRPKTALRLARLRDSSPGLDPSRPSPSASPSPSPSDGGQPLGLPSLPASHDVQPQRQHRPRPRQRVRQGRNPISPRPRRARPAPLPGGPPGSR